MPSIQAMTALLFSMLDCIDKKLSVGEVMMPFVVDDILVGLAVAAATAAAEELGKELVQAMSKTLFDGMATKDQLQSAVNAIEFYVHQEFDSVRNDILYSNVLTAISQLKSYMADPEHGAQFLGFAADHIATARSWSDIQFARIGPDFLRFQFAALVQCAATDITIWSAYALATDSKYKSELSDRIVHYVTILNTAADQIRSKETETISQLESKFERKYTGPTGTDVWDTGTAWYDTQKGGQHISHVEKSANGEGRARDDVRPFWQADVNRINADNDRRSQIVYTPVTQFSAAMASLKAKIS